MLLSQLAHDRLCEQPRGPRGIRICQDVVAEEHAVEYMSLFRKLKEAVDAQGDQVKRDGVLSMTIAQEAIPSSPLTRTFTVITVFATQAQMEAARTGRAYHAFEQLVGRRGVLHSTFQRELVDAM